jgi:hypothetical protein
LINYSDEGPKNNSFRTKKEKKTLADIPEVP